MATSSCSHAAPSAQVLSEGVTVPRPGWYPDPSGRGGTFRWWDGDDWTDRTRSRLPSQGNRLVVLLLGLSLVVSGGVVGILGWKSFHDARPAGQRGNSPGAATSPRPTVVAPRGASQQPDGQLDETTRVATLADGRMTLPGAPYDLVSGPVSVPGVFDAMFVANAPVSPRADGSQTWAATVGLGHISADAWSHDDLRGFTHKALTEFSEQFFGYRPKSVQHLAYATAIVSGRTCAKITAAVHFQAERMASRTARMVIIGCPAAGDSVIAAISSVPDDAPEPLPQLARRSLATLTLS